MFAAGSETTSTTLLWGLVYLIHHPEVQSQVQKEIHAVIGTMRRPNMKDKPFLPYTDAVILEVQRLADIAPLGLPHAVMEDVVFKGYYIPKGTMVMPFLHSVHRDTKQWKEPLKFDPSRFLDNGGKIVNRDRIMPFSAGMVLLFHTIHNTI